MKRLLTLLLTVILSIGMYPMEPWAAPDWPADVGILAEGGIVMDAGSGAVLYGENISVPYFPASITKIMTALLVIENSNLDDVVTFSRNAVYNVEAGSSNAGLDEGDQLTVRDCLYAMMLRSANEAANALAEHVAGSVEAFAVMMNEKAKALGCKETNFVNPSGLNNPKQHTTAYDMALIARAAFNNPVFVDFDSTTYYKLPPTIRNTEGLVLTPGHKMLEGGVHYYPGILGGKTGYTSLAGNTLVTCVKKDEMKLIVVILNGKKTHYEDTKALLDFGYLNFQTLKVADYETNYTTFENDMVLAGIDFNRDPALVWDKDSTIVIPKTAEFGDAVGTFTYEMTERDPVDAVAKIQYTYGQRRIGSTYLRPEIPALPTEPVIPAIIIDGLDEVTGWESKASPSESRASSSTAATGSSASMPENSGKDGKASSGFWPVWGVITVILALAAFAGTFMAVKTRRNKVEEEERYLRRQRRMQRLQEAGYSESDFKNLLDQKRSDHQPGLRGRGRNRTQEPVNEDDNTHENI